MRWDGYEIETSHTAAFELLVWAGGSAEITRTTLSQLILTFAEPGPGHPQFFALAAAPATGLNTVLVGGEETIIQLSDTKVNIAGQFACDQLQVDGGGTGHGDPIDWFRVYDRNGSPLGAVPIYADI